MLDQHAGREVTHVVLLSGASPSDANGDRPEFCICKYTHRRTLGRPHPPAEERRNRWTLQGVKAIRRAPRAHSRAGEDGNTADLPSDNERRGMTAWLPVR
jgi:hypothetical protein